MGIRKGFRLWRWDRAQVVGGTFKLCASWVWRCQVWSVVDHPDGCREASLGYMDPALILGAPGTCLEDQVRVRGLAAGTSLLCKRCPLD